SWKICSDFIEKNKDKVVTPPTDKQIELAKKLSKDKGMALPKDYEKNLKICKDFIDKGIKKK
ncbi:TPA: hypothetical protein RPV94_001910, partial [Campylobacter fetus subsp. venerealis]|nr:hypothetical protein [Campylobacter fetus subsp. venerealis]